MSTVVNKTDGNNRLRFESLSQSLQNVNIDIVHRATNDLAYKTISQSSSILGCHFFNELEEAKRLECASIFKRFFYSIQPLAQSLPELLHHQQEVTEKLLDHLKICDEGVLNTFVSLVPPLARDLGESFSCYFEAFFDVLIGRVCHQNIIKSNNTTELVHSSPQDTTGEKSINNDRETISTKLTFIEKKSRNLNSDEIIKLFECLSFLIKYQIHYLSESPNKIIRFYGPLLCHEYMPIRDLGAKVFIILTRKLKLKAFKTHFSQLFLTFFNQLDPNLLNINNNFFINELTNNSNTDFNVYENNVGVVESKASYRHAAQEAHHPTPASSTFPSTQQSSFSSIEIRHAIDGLSRLLFYTCKGVKGCIHSLGGEKVSVILTYGLLLHKMTSSYKIETQTNISENEAAEKNKKYKKSNMKQQHHISPIDVLSNLNNVYISGCIISKCISRLFRHLLPTNTAEIWIRLIAVSDYFSTLWTDRNYCGRPKIEHANSNNTPRITATDTIENYISYESLLVATGYYVEIMIFGLTHSRQRALSNEQVKQAVSKLLIEKLLHFCQIYFQCNIVYNISNNNGNENTSTVNENNRNGKEPVKLALTDRVLVLFSHLWTTFAYDSHFVSILDKKCLMSTIFQTNSFRNHPTYILSKHLLHALPFTLVKKFIAKPLLQAMAELIISDSAVLSVSSILDTDASSSLNTANVILTNRRGTRKTINKKSVNDSVNNNFHASNDSRINKQNNSNVKTINWLPLMVDICMQLTDYRTMIYSNNQQPSTESKLQTTEPVAFTGVNEIVNDCHYEFHLIAETCLHIVLNFLSAFLTSSNTSDNFTVEEVEHYDALLAMILLKWLTSVCNTTLFTPDSVLLSLLNQLLNKFIVYANRRHYEGDVSDSSASLPMLKLPWTLHTHFYQLCCPLLTLLHHNAADDKVSNMVILRDIIKSSLQDMICTHVHAMKSDKDIPPLNTTVNLNSSNKNINSKNMNQASKVTISMVWNVLFMLDVYSLSLQQNIQHQTPSSSSSSSQFPFSFSMRGQLYPAEKLLNNQEMFDLLNMCGDLLITPSYYLRIGLLKLLKQFEPIQLQSSKAQSHSHSSQSKKNTTNSNNASASNGNAGVVVGSSNIIHQQDIISLCYDTAIIPFQLHTERAMSMKLNNIEVIIRSGLLPVHYLKIVCSFCVGMLNIKFSPVWDSVINVIKTIASTQTKTHTQAQAQKTYEEKEEVNGLIDHENETESFKSVVMGEDIVWPLLITSLNNIYRLTNNTNDQTLTAIPSSPHSDTTTPIYDPLLSKLAVVNDENIWIPSNLAHSCYFYMYYHIDSRLELVTSSVESNVMMTAGGEGAAHEDSYDSTPEGIVPSDARCDLNTVYLSLWKVLEQCPNITLKRSRIVIPMFIQFLKLEYYRAFKDDPDIPYFEFMDLFSSSSSTSTNKIESDIPLQESSCVPIRLSVIKTRMIMYLKVFAAVTSPKQLFQHNLLYNYFVTLLSHPDPSVAKLSLQCLVNYKPSYLIPYKEHFKNMLDGKKIREELIIFNPAAAKSSNNTNDITAMSSTDSSNNNADNQQPLISMQHRPDLLPLLIRLSYGRSVSKSSGTKAREQSLARRTAVLSFLAHLESKELRCFLHLAWQGVLPSQLLRSFLSSKRAETNAISEEMSEMSVGGHNRTATSTGISINRQQYLSTPQLLEQWMGNIETFILHHLTSEAFSQTNVQNLYEQNNPSSQSEDIVEIDSTSRGVGWERQIGHLHLLEHVIKVMGFRITPYVGLVSHMVLLMLTHSLLNRKEVIDHTANDGNIDLVVDVDGDVDAADDVLEAIEEDEEDLNNNEYNEDINSKYSLTPKIGVNDNNNNEQDFLKIKNANQANRVRTLCILRLAELIYQYSSVFSFSSISTMLLPPLCRMSLSLPSAIGSSSKAPATLKLLHALCQYPDTLEIIATQSIIVESVITCIASTKVEPMVMKTIMDILTILLERNHAEALKPFSQLIVNSFSRRLVGKEFDCRVSELKLSQLNLNPSGSIKLELILLCGVAESIFNVSDTNVHIETESITALSTLLLGMLRSYTISRKVRIEESWVINILRVYKSLLWRIPDIKPHVAFVSRLFGPASHVQSYFNFSSVRNMLLKVYNAMAYHPSVGDNMKLSNYAIHSLVATTPSQHSLSESGRNFDICMPIFQSLSCQHENTHISNNTIKDENQAIEDNASTGSDKLSDEFSTEYDPQTSSKSTDIVMPKMKIDSSLPFLSPNRTNANKSKLSTENATLTLTNSDYQIFLKQRVSWSSLIGPAGQHSVRSASLCTAVIFECFRCMYDSEMTIRLSAQACLKLLVEEIALWSELGDIGYTYEGNWTDFAVSILVPNIHLGIKNSSDSVKRGFILLLKHMIKSFSSIETLLPENIKTSLHLDMMFLLQVDDIDQDFFENILHLQLHRRIKMMNKLKDCCSYSDALISHDINMKNTKTLSLSTIMHILLPLANYPLISDEYSKKDHLFYLQESSTFLGFLGSLLPWSQYYNLLKNTIKFLENCKPEKEKIILNALCAILDNFHFNMSKIHEESKAAIEVENDIETEINTESRQLLNEIDSIPLPEKEEDDEDEIATEEQFLANIHEPHSSTLNTNTSTNISSIGINKTASSNLSVSHQAKPASTTYSPTSTSTPENISKLILTSIVPWVKVFLLKSEKDHKGNDSKTVRTQIAVALTKLICRLRPPIVSRTIKFNYFQNLIISVISTLRSKDASARDSARESLAKMIQSMGMDSLYPVIYELKHTLKEGFQRHICNYTVRYILNEVLINYKANVDAPSIPILELFSNATGDGENGYSNIEINQTKKMTDKQSGNNANAVSRSPRIRKLPPVPEFDKCLPIIIECVLDDLTGDSHKDFAASEAGVGRIVIRESKGSKANDILEIIAQYLLFRPTYALLKTVTGNRSTGGGAGVSGGVHVPVVNSETQMKVSSIHAVTTPLLSLLHRSENPGLIGRIGEGLQRVALGLSRNDTVLAPELLLYIHSTLQPFVFKIIKDNIHRKQAIGKIIHNESTDAANTMLNIDDKSADDIFGEDFPSYYQDDEYDDEDNDPYSSNSQEYNNSSKPNVTFKKLNSNTKQDNVTGYRASVWLPPDQLAKIKGTQGGADKSMQRQVIEERNAEILSRNKVEDGMSAPKLTGVHRHKPMSLAQSQSQTSRSNVSYTSTTDPSDLTAVKFCLIFLHSMIKNDKLDYKKDPDICHMIIPFLPLLAHCLKLDDAANVAILALKNICILLSWDIDINTLSFSTSFPRLVGNQILKLMFKGGALLTTDRELVQACIKGLCSLFKNYNKKSSNSFNAYDKNVLDTDLLPAILSESITTDPSIVNNNPNTNNSKSSKKRSLSNTDTHQKQGIIETPLKPTNLRLLLQLLTTSIMEVTSSYQNSSFQLIKILIDNKVMLPEMYDLTDKLLEQIAISHRKGVRDSASTAVVSFLCTYPIGQKQYQNYVKKLLANCHYEYEEGRQSALFCLSNLIRLTNSTQLEQYAQMIFLPITLLCVNDESLKCRQTSSDLLLFLTKKVSPELFMTFYNYCIKWLCTTQETNSYDEFLELDNPTQILGLIKTGAKLISILIQAQPELLKKSSRVPKLIEVIKHILVLLLDPDSQPEQLSSNADNACVEGEIDGGSAPWMIVYQLLLVLEKLYVTLPEITDDVFMNKILHTMNENNDHKGNKDDNDEGGNYNKNALVSYTNNQHLLLMVEEFLLYRHIWVSAVSCRLLHCYLYFRNPKKLAQISITQNGKANNNEVLLTENFMYQTVRRLCIIINRPYLCQLDLSRVIDCLMYLLKVFVLNPQLSIYTAQDDNNDNDRAEEEEEETGQYDENNAAIIIDNDNNSDHDDGVNKDVNSNSLDTEAAATQNASSWLMQRLRGIGSDSRGQKRLHVLKVFEAILIMADSEDNEKDRNVYISFIESHVKQMIEPTFRAKRYLHGPDQEIIKTTNETAMAVLDQLERSINPAIFLATCAAVQQKLDKNKMDKKVKEKTEFVMNPKAYAMKKIAEQKKKKEAKKRKNDRLSLHKGIKRHRMS